MYRRRLELRGLKEFMQQVGERFGGLRGLSECIGIHFTSLYRRFNLLPWTRWGKEGIFLQRLAEAALTPLDRVLWFAGYNPFVKNEFELSAKALDALWELNLKIVEAIKSGNFKADQVSQLAYFALKALEKEAELHADSDGSGYWNEESGSHGDSLGRPRDAASDEEVIEEKGADAGGVCNLGNVGDSDAASEARDIGGGETIRPSAR